MALERISDIILLIIVSVSMPIYFVFIATLLINRKRSQFQSAFFSLCVSLGIADIINIFCSYLFVRSAGWGWFDELWLTSGGCGSLLALLSSIVIIGLSVSQHLGVLLMALNRFTAVVYSMKQETIWSTRNTTIAIALQWILPAIIVTPMSFTTFEYDYYMKDGVANKNSLSLKFCDQNYETAIVISGFLINLFVNAATCAMYIAVFIGVVRHSKRYATVSNLSTTSPAGNDNENSQNRSRHRSIGISQQNSTILQTSVGTVRSQTAHNRRELRLAVSGFLLFISMFMYFLYLLLALITGDAEFDDGVMYNIVCDVFGCINPYALLLLSRQTRIAFMRTLRCKKVLDR